LPLALPSPIMSASMKRPAATTMTPEEKARQRIDQQLELCGWSVQNFRDMNISAAIGVAVREFPLRTGEADYMLYADAKAIGVIEAKPEGHTLTGVETQSEKYTVGLPPNLPHYHLPLPFAYESTGTETRFTNNLEPNARSREVFTFHRPEELIRLAKLDEQPRTLIRQLPTLNTAGLWRVQIDAIQNLERSLAANRPRSLIQMATGSGKTFTAVNSYYRLIKFAKARRILFLVDRNNLGRQTLKEFQQFVSPYNAYKFTEEFTVQDLKRNAIDPAAKVCITTIQRLYSMLKGEADYLEENEESSLFEAESSLIKSPLPVVYNANIPIETFDFIVVDECYRSIYNVWRQVLEYFDAFIIGLTATPTKQTIGFFGGNLVQDYTHERAVADGVNVGYDVYRIETQITRDGATLVRQPGIFVPHRDRRTKGKKYKELDDDLTYTANQLDRDVVAENQIRLVVRTFRDRLFTDIFPGRTEVPKTLVFAKTDLHAEDIVRIIREEFGKGNDFCQKITSKTTGKKPEDLLADFRNAYNPRIAVTVDMIATGTDVKPLECLLFMRNIRSLSYFEQMKGRGCRVVDSEAATMFSLPPDREPTEAQLDEVEQERMRVAPRPFHQPRLREAILAATLSLEQVIDEQSPDTLVRSGFDAVALEKAQSMLASFRQFLDDHKDEIEAIQVLYSRPYRAGLRFSQVKDLAAAIQRPPHRLHPERLWQAYEAVEPDKVKAHGGKALVDCIALVRHALNRTRRSPPSA
jgi:type I restriction enzyme R subunit